MQLNKLLNNISYSSNDNLNNINITNVTNNSKEVQNGSLFIALAGQKTNGNIFIKDAINNGAAAVISSKNNNLYSIPYVKINNPRQVMSQISSVFYNNASKKIKIIGVTGTNGKTSICEIISHILNETDKSNCTIGTLGVINEFGILNTNFTTPESNKIQHYLNIMVENSIENAIIEVSSHSLELNRVDNVNFNIGIYTNLSSEHLDFHKNIDSYFQSKLKLFKKLKSGNSAIINIDDKYADQIIHTTNSNIITYSLSNNADIFARNYNCTINGIAASLSIFGEQVIITSSLLGKYNLMNIMASIGACIALNLSIEDIIRSIASFKIIPGRLEPIESDSKKKIFIDYAHTPDAYKKVLSTLRSFENKKLITIFGCGGNRDSSNRSKMASIAEEYSDFVIITSDNPRYEDQNQITSEILLGFKGNNYLVNLNRKDAIINGLNMMTDNHILIIFGKGRENYELVKNKKIFHSDINIIKENL